MAVYNSLSRATDLINDALGEFESIIEELERKIYDQKCEIDDLQSEVSKYEAQIEDMVLNGI